MSYQVAPHTWHDEEEHRRILATRLNSTIDGKLNSTGSVTLTASTTTTVVTDKRASAISFIQMMPTTANAAAEAWHIASQTSGTFTIIHASAATTDRTFRYLIIG